MTDPLAITSADLGRAEAWVRRHGGRLPPSPLLTARIALRAASRHRDLVLVLGCAAALVGWALLAELIDYSLELDNGTSLRKPVELAAVYLLMAAASGWNLRRQQHAERRLAATLPRRVTHSDRRGLLAVLGGWHLAANTVVYLGGIAVAAAIALRPGTENLTLGVVLAGGTAAMAAIAGSVTAQAIRRPALADDEAALAADDLLRVEDAQRAVPFPLFTAFVAAVDTTTSGGVMWMLLGYTGLGAVLWTLAVLVERKGSMAIGSGAGMLGDAR